MSLIALGILMAFAVYSLFSKSISKSLLTLPILFTALGLALSQPLAEGVPPEFADAAKAGLAEITLVLVLFSDASRVRFRRLVLEWHIPARMLVIGLPLTIAFGTAAAYLVDPVSGLATAFLTAAVLTPTDAALGQSVLASREVPAKLGDTINVESGLNDGLAFPFVLLGAMLASSALGAGGPASLALDALVEVILGPLAGVAVGWLSARSMDWAQDRGYMFESAGAVIFLVTAFAAYLLAGAIHGNGFIAAFVAGMVFGNTYRHEIHFISEFMEGAGQLLTMSAFLVFGAFLLPDGLAHAGLSTLLLAVLFLTLVRVVPILLSLTGSGLGLRDMLFLGWFGPRGLASILFTLLVLEQFDLPGEEALLACVSLTVALSILLHGMSAAPLAKRIGLGARDAR